MIRDVSKVKDVFFFSCVLLVRRLNVPVQFAQGSDDQANLLICNKLTLFITFLLLLTFYLFS